MNGGGGSFVAVPAGVMTTTPSWPWGVRFLDLDADGDLDVLFPEDGSPVLGTAFRNVGGTFIPIAGLPSAGFTTPYAYAAFSAELNGDGFPDLVAVAGA